MSVTLTIVILAAMWLGLAALVRALAGKRPWQTLLGDRKRVAMVRSLEEIRHALTLVLWAGSVWMVVVFAGYFSDRGFAFVTIWVLALAFVGEMLTHTEAMQKLVMNWLFAFSNSYGRYFGWLRQVLRVLESLAAKLSPDQPVFRDREELSHLVQYHHRTHQVLSTSAQKQLQALLKVEGRPIQSKIIPLEEAQLVKATDTIGPLLLAELHDSSYMSFAVYNKRRTKIVGILDQGVAVSHASHSGKVAELMEERVVYLPHNATFASALQTFIETSSPISVIIDDDNQPVGVLYVQDVLRELFGPTEEKNE